MTMLAEKPITPAEAKRSATVPPEVLTVVNEFLARGGGREVTIDQGELVKAIIERFSHISVTMLFAHHWLDFEAAYRAAGWSVEYENPGYNETYEPFWTFRPKGKRR